MNIHVVQPGDTIYSIANNYGVSPERLSLENDIIDPNNLIIGEALVIIQPSQIYIVQEGDSLESIAKTHGTDIMELLRNNPNISNRELYIGEEIVISYISTKTETIETNGFAYPFIDRSILRKTLPYLTYLTIYTYQFTRNGSLIEIDDSEIIQISKEYGVAPVMYLTASYNGINIDTDIAHILISNTQVQNTLIDNILSVLRNKGYYGINVDTPYIQPLDRQPYVDFIANITKRLNSEGFLVSVTIAPSTFEVSTGIIYTGVDYAGLSQAANSILYQLTYAWRYPHSLPISVLPFDRVIETLYNAITLIPPEKCALGISNIGYIGEFPFFASIINVNFISYRSAIELAHNTGSIIQFNEPSYSSYYRYMDNEREYMAWFLDNRGIYPMIEYSGELGLQGLSIWNIMYFITNTWLLIQTQSIIKKIYF